MVIVLIFTIDSQIVWENIRFLMREQKHLRVCVLRKAHSGLSL